MRVERNFPLTCSAFLQEASSPFSEDSDNWARKALCREDRTGLKCQLAILKHPDIFQLTTLQEWAVPPFLKLLKRVSARKD